MCYFAGFEPVKQHQWKQKHLLLYNFILTQKTNIYFSQYQGTGPQKDEVPEPYLDPFVSEFMRLRNTYSYCTCGNSRRGGGLPAIRWRARELRLSSLSPSLLVIASAALIVAQPPLTSAIRGSMSDIDHCTWLGHSYKRRELNQKLLAVLEMQKSKSIAAGRTRHRINRALLSEIKSMT